MIEKLPSAILLDRDGVINREVNYLGRPQDLELIPGVVDAIASLNARSIPVLVVTNQAGVGRGYYTETDVDLVHDALQNLLALGGAKIDRFYYCPHHPTAGIGKYLKSCTCRKPEPGMLLQAAADYDLDLTQCYLVGDKTSDMISGWNAGCKTILVQTGYGQKHWQEWHRSRQPDRVVRDLVEAVEWIIKSI
jgi:D-glycero-D-manno-heptose 1,7-bisphosphate phosphatase